MIKFNFFKKLKLNDKLLWFITILILSCCLIIGITSYNIAKTELDDKGKTILKNAVEEAIMLVDIKSKEVEAGNISLSKAQEQVKEYLDGKKNSNGTRTLNDKINLGEHGYFIIYGKQGLEVMHPTLEGQNAWNLTDKSNSNFKIVQDQIKKAETGGGFTYYSWNLPNSNEVSQKISYSELAPSWGWVITASAYTMDFNEGINDILIVVLASTILILIVGSFISIFYINGITRPLNQVVENMKLAENGYYSSISGIKRFDEIGELVEGFNSMVSSINVDHQRILSQEEKILNLAYYDQLSGLPNRNMYKDYIDRRIEMDLKKAYLFLLDIKDFKFINSMLSNKFGDKIIKVVGDVLKEFQNENWMVARLSGNEFGAWIENEEEDEIKQAILFFQKRFDEELKKIEFNQKFKFYISYSAFPEDGQSFEDCYKKASIALNYAKENNLDEAYKFNDDMETYIEKESQMINYVEEAINNDEFIIYYQNKVKILDNEIIGVEALARWNSKALGFVSPSVFIPIVYKSNLTTKFTKMIIEKVLSDYRSLEKKFSKDIKVSINISPLFFFEKDFIEMIKNAINSRGINPQNVIFEITEDIFINDFDAIEKIVSELKSFGVKISLDDFGTGYSSLTYIKNIKFDELKIDKSFIDNLGKDERLFELLKAIETIARTYGYEVVAEGVETAEQLRKVAEAGFDIVQGYIYSKPEPI